MAFQDLISNPFLLTQIPALSLASVSPGQVVLLFKTLGLVPSPPPESEAITSKSYSLQGFMHKDLASRLKEVKVLREDAVCSGLRKDPDKWGYVPRIGPQASYLTLPF